MQARVRNARGSRRGLTIAALIFGVVFFAGPSAADLGVNTVSINDVTVVEGNSGTINAVFTLTLSPADPDSATTVEYTTHDGSATALSDYTPVLAQQVTFAQAETSKTISIPVLGDTTDEIDETFTISLASLEADIASGDAGTGTGTINDDDGPNVTIGDITVGESAGSATFTVSLSASSPQDVSVNYATSDQSATAGNDYTASGGTATVQNGQTSKTFTVPIIDDSADENDETFAANLSGAVDGTITDSSAQATITDNDNPPTVSINDVSVTEGNSGSTNAQFTATLSAASGKTVTVNYATAANNATAGSDYTHSTGSLTFNPGDTSETLSVPVVGDTFNEANETFFVNLSGPANATLGDAQGVGTIIDNDGQPALSINNVSVNEGNSGTVNASFTVSLSPASGQTVTVNYATADGAATAPGDYAAKSGLLTFAPGDTSETITVTVNGDTLNEANEGFLVNLSSASNATIADGQGVGTILDDDPAPSLSINDVTVTEGNAGTVNAVFTVSLSSSSGSTVAVNYATANGTAVSPGDYDAIPSTQLQFSAGQTSKTVTVVVNADTVDEANETFSVNLSGASNATISDSQGIGSITDDDGPSISVGNVTVPESGGNAVVTVSLSASSPQTITVQYATANGSALSPGDYGGTSGTLTFDPGQTSKTISVAIVNDSTDEANENFFLNLSSSTNASIGDSQGEATITDDDGPAITINNVASGEADGNATFTITLSSPSPQNVTVQYATGNGTATAGNDYTATSGTLTIAAGAASGTVQVPLTNDVLDEDNETFFLNLSNATNASIADSQGQATITDDDAMPTVSIANQQQLEGNSGTTSFSFTVSLSAASGRSASVSYATQNGTAVAPGDYQSTSGTVTFAPGETSKQVTVIVNGDTLNEANETFTVNLSSPVNATIQSGQGAGTGTITNDDGQPALSINDVTVDETGNAVLTVTLAPTSGQTVGVSFATSDGPAPAATAPSDYGTTGGVLSFAPGDMTKTVTVPIVPDTLDEQNEKFTVTLSNASNATIADATGIVTVTDDDAPPSLSIGDAAVTEGDAGTANATFTLTLTGPSGQPIVVTYSTANVTAVAPGDYTAATNQTITFDPGQTSKTISVPVVGDTLDEPNETFTVNISAPLANVTDGQGVGLIADNDPTPSLVINDATVAADTSTSPPRVGEGNSGQGACTSAPFSQCAVFTVTLSAASGQTVTVSFLTVDGTAGSADYVTTGGVLTFTPGLTTQQIRVPIKGDVTDEATQETFTVNLSNPTNATIGDGQGVGTIIDDDGAPALSVTGASEIEGNPEDATVVVSLAPSSGQQVTVQFSTANGSASAPGDYLAKTQTIVFAPGQTSKAIIIELVNDTLDEDDETFEVNLSGEQNAIILSGQDRRGFVTITDDDDPPTVAVGDASVTEGNGGSVAASFSVTLSAASGRSISLAYSTADGSATAPADYTSSSGTLSFAPGETSKTIAVFVNGDGAAEPDESFTVDLSSAVNVTIADGSGQGTIVNDDTAPPPPPTESTTTSTTSTSTSTTSTTTSTPPPPPPRQPQLGGMRISAAPVVLIEDFAPIGVTCSKNAAKTCLGTVAVQTQTLALAILDGRPSAKAITLGRESFAIPRGRTDRVLVGLSKRAVKAVQKTGKLRVTVVVTARDSAGKRAKISKKLWLKTAKRPKPKPKRPRR